MGLEEIIEDLHELVKLQETKIKGLSMAVDVFKNREKKVIRELKYLRSQYDETDCIDNAIQIVMKVYEQI